MSVITSANDDGRTVPPPKGPLIATLGLFVDAPFRVEISGGQPRVFCGDVQFGFMRFAAAVGGRLGSLVLIARETDDRDATPHELPGRVEILPLPDYDNLRALASFIIAIPVTLVRYWRALERLDAIWVSGAHPLAPVLILLAMARRRRPVILVRQDAVAYFRARLPSRWWKPALGVIWLTERVVRLLSRRVRTTAVGGALARRYGAPSDNVLEMKVSISSRAELAPQIVDRSWSGQIDLLTVGRIEPEKAPFVTLEMLAGLPSQYRLTWVGEGRMAAALRERADQGGLADRLRLPGFVPYGPALMERYRSAHAFIHIAVTEGLPQVLLEAMAAGLPIAATDVGGVRELLDDGRAGILVPPGRPDALANAVQSLRSDGAMRSRLANRALDLAREASLERESARVAAFIAGPDA